MKTIMERILKLEEIIETTSKELSPEEAKEKYWEVAIALGEIEKMEKYSKRKDIYGTVAKLKILELLDEIENGKSIEGRSWELIDIKKQIKSQGDFELVMFICFMTAALAILNFLLSNIKI